MKSVKCINIALILLFISTINYSQKKINGILFQSSPIIALLNGVMNDNFTVGQITKHGDFGLGTFNGVDGEMIVLDGIVYRVDYKGIVTLPYKSSHTPFFTVAYFHPDTVIYIKDSLSLKSLQEYIDKSLKSANLIYAVKISGMFKYIESRSEEKQLRPYSNLADVLKDQSVFKFKNINGTMVGFKIPSYLQGVNIPGYHFHFLSEDKKSGGHTLDCISGDLKIEIQTLFNLEIKFPANDEFYKAGLEKKPVPGL